MTEVITAPQPIPRKGFTVFLAGAIDMGQAVDWQAHVIEKLDGNHEMVVLNPRRPFFGQDTLDEQIKWELHALEQADMIMMWFPKSFASTLPITDHF